MNILKCLYLGYFGTISETLKMTMDALIWVFVSENCQQNQGSNHPPEMGIVEATPRDLSSVLAPQDKEAH